MRKDNWSESNSDTFIQEANGNAVVVGASLSGLMTGIALARAGDAAHLPTPLTASGFNASLQDAATLTECIEKGIKGSAASEALLEYESRRLKTARQIVQSGQSFSRSFGR
ncbi:FAD-dependent monooxygenase [Neobacillus drentensis]|uniref:FAD-dependent oxidoreductase n=1 Tax=Neobacillus drentensis TaxID=220684 RepID=UPI001F397E0F|nr:FAD-dependent monooxygenase [Neobacillus drentensis]ULT54512.1 FAD-dependent monooxygenase [Neobacillus drentensis]